LQEGQSAITDQETKLKGVQKETEETRIIFNELNSLSQIEHKNIDASRSRLSELHNECSQWESRVAAIKNKCTEEENRYRTVHNRYNDQMRILQSDALKLQSDIKTKKKSLEELERLKKSIEAEAESRQREISQQHLSVSRESSEATRVLSGIQTEVRSARLELEQVNAQKKHVEAELTRVQDSLSSESKHITFEIEDSKRRASEMKKLAEISEKEYRLLREKVSSLESEKGLISLEVEDLKRSKGDLDRLADERRRLIEDESAQAQAVAQNAARSARQATTDLEQKKAEYDSLVSECRTVERRVDDLKRTIKDQEGIIEKHKELLRSLHGEQSALSKDLQTMKREEDDLKIRLQSIRVSVETESRASDEHRRRLALLVEEEEEWKEREARLKSAHSHLKKSLEECQIELNELRSAGERERRSLSDARGKKNLLEAEIARLEEELKFAREQVEEEERRRVDVYGESQRARDELSKIQKEVISAQRRHSDSLRLDAEMKRKESEAVQLQHRIRTETEALSNALKNERHTIDTLALERDSVLKDTKTARDELKQLQRELTSARVTLESCLAQQQHAIAVKEEIQQEISHMRETEKVELMRAERVNETYKDLERRLKEVRAELGREESSYARVKSRSIEEESKLAERHRSLYSATEELSKVESVIAEVHSSIHEERGKAIQEISKLGQAKQSVVSQMFLLSEAKRRADRLGNTAIPITPSEEFSSHIDRRAMDNYSSVQSNQNFRSRINPSQKSAFFPPHDYNVSSLGSAPPKLVSPDPIRPKATPAFNSVFVEDSPPRRNVSIQDEISDLRAEMIKLSAQSAAVLQTSENM
jgi:chromosome segregation ATPase